MISHLLIVNSLRMRERSPTLSFHFCSKFKQEFFFFFFLPLDYQPSLTPVANNRQNNSKNKTKLAVVARPGKWAVPGPCCAVP